MRDDFCAFILTHGRPDSVVTYKQLRDSGYTGKIYVVIDDEDKTADQYFERYGSAVLQFSKAEVAKTFDEADNFNDRRAIVYARNVCFRLAREVGCRYFIQLDDDYSSFFYRFNSRQVYGAWRIRTTMDALFEAMLEFYLQTPITTIAMSQGGDHIGGDPGRIALKRKAMNSFICSTDRPFTFHGRVNEDVNTYTTESRRGNLFFTTTSAQLNQLMTQSNAGGMTDLYLDSGTYVKSFYSVMFCPSPVKIGELADNRSPHRRIHHAIDWTKTAPKILREEHRRIGDGVASEALED